MNEPFIPTDLLTPREAAELAGTSTGTIRRWCHSGALPAFRVGGRLRISQADVLAMFKRVETVKPHLMTRAEATAKAAEVDRILREAGIRK